VTETLERLHVNEQGNEALLVYCRMLCSLMQSRIQNRSHENITVQFQLYLFMGVKLGLSH